MAQILIVDDSPTIRKMVRASLKDVDAEFVEASNGLEAIEQLAIGPVAMMILDLNMPDMHGIDVLKFVRGHTFHRAIPIVVLTTRGDEASRMAAEQAGATSYLTKPFTPHDLASVVRGFLGASSAASPQRPGL
jgi:two-component system, chemotaxis family, chemotaxis protein CheY